jgi:hypothetical protein
MTFVPDGLERLKGDHDFVIFDEVADDEEQSFRGHDAAPNAD